MSLDKPELNVDDDQLYEAHDEGEGLGRSGSGPISSAAVPSSDGGTVGSGGGEKNINRFRNRVMNPAESATELSEPQMKEAGVREGDAGSAFSPQDPHFMPPEGSESDPSLSLSPPSALVHLLPPTPRSERAPRLYVAPKEEAGLRRMGVCGVSSLARNNVIWHSSSGE